VQGTAAAVPALSASEATILEAVATFSREVVAPAAEVIDRDAAFPHRIYKQLSEMGFIGLLVSEADGGLGGSLLLASHLYEVLAEASASVALIVANSAESLIPITRYAEPAVRSQILQRVLSGGEIPCFALTEAGAGSDVGGIRTTARRDGDAYLLDGRKIFCTNGAVGGVFTVFAVTEPDAPKRSRLSAFAVDRDTPGFAIGRVEDTMGTRGSPLTELLLDGVRVPVERRLGAEGQGLEVAIAMLNESRVGAAAHCVGMGQAALDRSLAYAMAREQFDQRIIDFQAVQLMIADMAIRTEAARQLTHTAARAHDAGRADAVILAAMCKTFASDAAVQSALDAIQVHGGSGFLREVGVERILRDAKAYQIFDGTNQIQRITIAKQLRRRATAAQR
jgi:alkylation response protein AidB-like acyl-CoA dehydrogenase